MTFFSADDFECYEWTKESLADLCNQKLQREGKVVYICEDPRQLTTIHFPRPVDATHQGLLICVEKIEKKSCTHPDVLPVNSGWYYRCSDCGMKLQPTGWKLADD